MSGDASGGASPAADGGSAAAFGLRQRAEELAARLPPLLVAAERVAATVAQGVHGRRRVGQGETFWQFRRYEQGDARSNIDWRRSARAEQLFVRETEWEAAQSVWLWRDASLSMGYRSDTNLPTKAAHADLLLLATMALLVHGGERIALLGDGGRPATGRAVLNRLAETIVRTADAESSNPATGLPPDAPLPRHAAVVLIGDFLSPMPAVEAALRPLAERGCKGHILQVLDPAEVTMPFAGRSRFRGLEQEGDLLVGRAESLRQRYLGRLSDHQGGLTDLAGALGWTFATHTTDRSAAPALLALYAAMAAEPEL